MQATRRVVERPAGRHTPVEVGRRRARTGVAGSGEAIGLVDELAPRSRLRSPRNSSMAATRRRARDYPPSGRLRIVANPFGTSAARRAAVGVPRSRRPPPLETLTAPLLVSAARASGHHAERIGLNRGRGPRTAACKKNRRSFSVWDEDDDGRSALYRSGAQRPARVRHGWLDFEITPGVRPAPGRVSPPMPVRWLDSPSPRLRESLGDQFQSALISGLSLCLLLRPIARAGGAGGVIAIAGKFLFRLLPQAPVQPNHGAWSRVLLTVSLGVAGNGDRRLWGRFSSGFLMVVPGGLA